MKGKSSCHIPSDNYREGWDRIFGEKERGGMKMRRIHGHDELGAAAWAYDIPEAVYETIRDEVIAAIGQEAEKTYLRVVADGSPDLTDIIHELQAYLRKLSDRGYQARDNFHALEGT
ncbi:MAG: hypothetical protein UR84_C0024G0005 [candidate division WS6 bacterium GW2011_GWD1_35_594]|nr:MAG: hypothetical protein UR84_C0024G0005 [candidate division WS6 bacterium GW2011_GWD1_35_594]